MNQIDRTSIVSVDAMLSGEGDMAATGPSRIHIEAGRIASIESCADLPNGLLAMPAPVNAHDHGRGLRALAFGAADDALEAWLPTLAREPRTSAYLRAAVAFARMAEGGVAATNHSHGPQDPDRIVEEAGAVWRAARDVGIRVAFAAPFADRNPLAYGDQDAFLALAGPAARAHLAPRLTPQKTVAAFLRDVEEMAEFEHAGFSIQYCPVGAQWVSEASLAAIAGASAASGRRVHMHLLETRYQRGWADHAYPGGLIRRLDELGLLSPRLSVAHGVFMRDEEAALLAERGVIVSVNTSSNLRLRSGLAPVRSFLAAGLAFGLGLDATPLDDDDDMLREMRLAWLHHRGFGLEDSLTAKRLFRAALTDGRRAVVGEDGGGVLAAGAPADLLVLDYAAMTRDLMPGATDPVTVLLTRATRAHISQLIVAGRTIVQDGSCVTVDRAALESELIAQARAAWTASTPDESSLRMKRAVRQFYGCGCHVGNAPGPLAAS